MRVLGSLRKIDLYEWQEQPKKSLAQQWPDEVIRGASAAIFFGATMSRYIYVFASRVGSGV